jgi:hypothetical protein
MLAMQNRFSTTFCAAAGVIFCLTLTAAGDSLVKDYPNKVALKATPKVWAFELKDVRLEDELFKGAMERNAAWLLSLEPDRFLAWFRKEAGLEPKAAVYGGWESQGVAGHCLGHYLSACAMQYAATGDEEFKTRATYIVSELALCQDKNGDGYVGAIPEGKRAFAEVSRGEIRSKGFDLNGIWVPWYTEHKVLAGLRDVYVQCGNTQALEVMRKLGDWVCELTKNLTEAQWQTMLACEHGGMNEVMADLYGLTGEKKYLESAEKFYHKHVLEPLRQEENRLAGLHANTQVPKMIGAARIYELTGDKKYETIARFFWETVVNHYTFVNGGNSANEHFGPADKLSEPLHDTTETCNTYNMLKLTRQLYAMTPKASYMDYYERALVNHILASQHPTTGMVKYKGFLDMPAQKHFCHPTDSFWCCVGTGFENHVKYGEAIYAYDAESLYVNLYIASTVRWKEKGVTVKQVSGLPAGESVVLTFTCETPTVLTLKLRKPFWAEGVTIALNGKPVTATVGPAGYIELEKTFRTGDVVTAKLPMRMRIEGMPDKPNRIAFLYGPTVLATDLSGNAPLPALVGEQDALIAATKPAAALEFVGTGIGRTLGSDGWKTTDVRMIPLFAIADQRYSVYLDSFTPAQWKDKLAEYEAELARQKALDARTTDVLRVGEMQPERDHNLVGENTSAGDFSGRKWRHATDGGWFAFEMKVSGDSPMELVCTYWGGDAGNRVFDILVDGVKVASQTLERNKPDQFFDTAYALPRELTHGKEKVTVRFQAQPGKLAGGLYGCRMMKAE